MEVTDDQIRERLKDLLRNVDLQTTTGKMRLYFTATVFVPCAVSLVHLMFVRVMATAF
jgi:hypothetical protein